MARGRSHDDSGACIGAVRRDPMTAVSTATMGMQAIGGLAGASGANVAAQATLAGGQAAAVAGQMQQAADENSAQQLEQNASLTRATAQRQALDERLKSNMVLSTLTAKGAASGVNLTGATPLAIAGEIGRRGEYQALTTMAAGENQALGMENQAAAERYSGTAALIGGQYQEEAAGLNAKAQKLGGLSTLASAGGSMFKTYGAFNFPNLSGSSGMS